jgi:hypothetical protein
MEQIVDANERGVDRAKLVNLLKTVFGEGNYKVRVSGYSLL